MRVIDADALMIVLSWVGIFTVAACIIMMAYCAFNSLRDAIRSLRWLYKYKHRFDKQPTAACYCKDCVHHGKKNKDGANPCCIPGVSRWTPDNGFCYEAEPITVKEAEKRALERR